MIKKYLLFIFLIATCQVFSQEVYFNTGKNFTKYIYKNSNFQTNPNLQSGTGNFYEVGLTTPFINNHISYSTGLALNEYNAIGGNLASSYRWDTKYLGIHGGISYSFFPRATNPNKNLDFGVNAGINGATIIYGKQEVNGAYYDLINQKEFSGIILESVIGFQLKYHVSSFGFLSMGYNFCQSVNLTNTTSEKLFFNTNQLELGIHFTIK